MKKILQIMCDVAVTVGCCVGIGFISGKEAQVFFGNKINAVVFCVVFFAVNFALREHCRKNGCQNVHALNISLFNRAAPLFDALVALCSFVCIATVLAGVEQCLDSILPLGSKLPLYAFATAVVSSLLLNGGMSALKIVNIVAVAMAIVLIALLFATKSDTYAENLQVPLYQPVVYALFSLTMSLGVVTKLGEQSSRADNLIATALSSIILTVLMLLVLPSGNFNSQMPLIDGITNKYLLGFAVITMLLSAVTGLVANALPIEQYLYGVIGDKTLCSAVTFGFALAFSIFGFDFAVKVGYALVSLMGAVVVVLSLIKTIISAKRDNVDTAHAPLR